MLIPVPPQFRKRRGKAKAAVAPPPPPTEAIIVSVVSQGDAFSVRLFFNVAVTTDGSDIPQFIVETYGGPQGLSSVIQVDANTIEAQCGDGGVDIAQAWSISSAPAGLTVADGLPFSLPQSGVTA